MIEVISSAPGKLVLMGEYAVLEGAPALVMGVNRRAGVRLSGRAGHEGRIAAPDLGLPPVSLSVAADGKPLWNCSDEVRMRLGLVDQTLNGLAAAGCGLSAGGGFDLQLDTSGFFDGDAKLGLGSSAALTVALASAVAEFAGHGARASERIEWLNALLRLHRDFQGGHGSGVDVAASLAGGLIAYRLDRSGHAGFKPLRWPDALAVRFVWTGTSASTKNFLARLAIWREHNGREYASQMEGLTAIAQTAVDAALSGHASNLLDALRAYAMQLDGFGAAAGLDILSSPHRRIGAIAENAGVVYKSCGAGGGDFGALFSLDPARLSIAERNVAAAGFRCVPLALDVQGLRIERNVH